jgi:predicted peroxiredoxin
MVLPDMAQVADMPDTAPRLVILLNSTTTRQAALVPLRYAATAAALDVAVEVHAVSGSVALFAQTRDDGLDTAAWLAELRQAIELEVEFFVCPVALAEHGLRAGDLLAEVAGVRGAPSLLAAGMAPGARFMVF